MDPILKMSHLVLGALLCADSLLAQGVAVFPSDYSNVNEGPHNSQYLPLAWGSSRVQIVYDAVDLQIPDGAQIRSLGFREDRGATWVDVGRTLQLEIRMGYCNVSHDQVQPVFDQNYAAPPITVFGPAALTLPDLRNPSAPLVDGKVWIQLTTPFVYQPGSRNLVVEYRIYGTSGGGAPFNYYLDRADFYSPVANGPAGCLHSGGGPAVLTLQPVRAGAYFQASAAQAPASSLAVLLFAVNSQLLAPFPLNPLVAGIDPTCHGQIPLINPLPLVAISDAWGNGWWSFWLPNDPVLLDDLYIACQGAFFDFFAPGGLVVSNGSQLQVGVGPRMAVVYYQGPPAVITTGNLTPGYCPVSFFAYQ